MNSPVCFMPLEIIVRLFGAESFFIMDCCNLKFVLTLNGHSLENWEDSRKIGETLWNITKKEGIVGDK